MQEVDLQYFPHCSPVLITVTWNK